MNAATATAQEVFVVFSGQTDLSFLKYLKPGFRHCFAVIRDGARWLIVDPMSHRLEVSAAQVDSGFDLPGWLSQRGYRVVPAPARLFRHRVAAPLPFTCVEAMKRLIGLHDWRVFTPWQLYRRLMTPAA